MAFFGSSGYERKLKRTISTSDRDRDRPHRRDRPAGARAAPNGGASSPLKSLGVDELGFVVTNVNDIDTTAVLASPTSGSQQQDVSASTSASASASASLNPSGTAAGPSSSTGPSNAHASASQQHRIDQGTPQKGGSCLEASSGTSRQRERANSSSPSSSRRRTSSNGLKAPSTPEGVAATGSGGSPRNSLRARSSPDLKEKDKQRERVKSRPSPPLRQGLDEKPRSDQGEGELLVFSRTTSTTGSVRAPKGPRPLIRPESRSTSPAINTMSSMTRANGGLHSNSGSLSLSTAQINKENEEKSPKREKSFEVTSALSRSRQEDYNLSPPSMSTKRSNASKNNGNVSDSSYGSPLSELGVVGSFTVKSLLARPAASTLPNGVRSEPDIDYGNTSSMTAASRRYLRAGGTSPIPHSPSVYSQSTVDASAVTVDNLRKAALSEPETSSPTAMSLGRSRGLEWGHILAKKNTPLGNQTHTREQSASFSLSSPSEGTMFPYGRAARERNQSTPVYKIDASRAPMQLTTNAVKRLSALGTREVDRLGTASTPYAYASQTASRSPVSPIKQDSSSGFAEGRQKSSRHRMHEGKKESATVSRREDSPPPVGLTPSELIMHRYKQQERRRQELEKGATKDVEQPEKVLKQSTAKPREKSSKKSANKGKDDDDEGVGPYYTVFGASSEKKQNIGNARDSAFGLFDREADAKAAEKAVVAEMSTPGPQVTTFADFSLDGPLVDTTEDCKLVHQRSLRRKLSKRMPGKARDGSVSLKAKENGEEGVFSSSEDAIKSRPSLSLSTVTSKRPDLDKITNTSKPLKTSLDSFVAVSDAGTDKPMPSATNGPPRLEKHNGRSASEGDKEKGKIWGFVKKISSHTLNNKYRRNSAEFIPPVPDIPLEHTINIDISSESVPVPIVFEREKKPKRSVHGRRPSTAPALNSDVGRGPVEGRFAVMRKKPSLAQLTREPRSSSPSSDSMKFKPSTNSSASSLNENNGQKAALTKSPLIQHILPPETLHMLEEFNAQYSSLSNPPPNLTLELVPPQENTADLFYGYRSIESPIHQALPVPPRKIHQSTTPASSRSESPTIPTFSADNAINTFGLGTRNRAPTMSSTFTGADFGTGRKAFTTTDSIQDKTTPPLRPPRSMKRGPSPSANLLRSKRSSGSSKSSSSPSTTNARDSRLSMSAQSAASTCRPSPSGGSFRFSSHFSRSQSSPQHTDSGDTSPSPPELLENVSPISASDSTGSAITFREGISSAMNLSPKIMLSEKEKVDKWNALLDRSDRAGGTLQIGLGGLLSDNIRDSALEPIRDDLSFCSY